MAPKRWMYTICSQILQEIELDTDALKLKIYSYLSEKAVDEDSLHQKNCSLLPFCKPQRNKLNKSCWTRLNLHAARIEAFGALGAVMRVTRRSVRTRPLRILLSHYQTPLVHRRIDMADSIWRLSWMLRFFSLLSICFLLFVLYELECKLMKTFLLLAVIAS